MSGKISKEDFEKAKRNLQTRHPIPDDLEEQERQKDEILEMWHKAASVNVPDPRQASIAAIRLFVERVDIHFRVLGGNLHFSNALRRELAIMEKEANGASD